MRNKSIYGFVWSFIVLLFVIWIVIKILILAMKIALVVILCTTGIIISIVVPTLIIMFFIKTWKKLKAEEFNILFSLLLILSTVIFGISIGLFWLPTVKHSLSLISLFVSSSVLMTIVLYPFINRRRLIAKYRISEQHLIKP
jgi:uncharacterized membrane protein YedE/YeeE